MATPSKSEILEKALELWHTDQARSGNPAFGITPELEELREGGYISAAQSELMQNEASRFEMDKWHSYAEMENFADSEQQNHDNLKKLIDDVLAFGDLLLIANKGVGKTNSLMVLTDMFRALPDTRVVIFEDFPKFCLEFSCVPYMKICDSDVSETKHTVDLSDYFLRHESDYSVCRGSEIQDFLQSNKDCLFTMDISDIERSCFFVYSVVQWFYRRAYLRKYKNYGKTERVIFVIEESQNVFDSSVVSKKIFNRLRKIFSVARNLELHFVLASQRLQDLNTKIRGRTLLLLGKPSLDDYALKIDRLLRHSRYRSGILEFERGQFLHCASDSVIQFPKFERVGFPLEWCGKLEMPVLEIKRKRQGFFTKLFNRSEHAFEVKEMH